VKRLPEKVSSFGGQQRKATRARCFADTARVAQHPDAIDLIHRLTFDLTFSDTTEQRNFVD
jgi:hypothetical protein